MTVMPNDAKSAFAVVGAAILLAAVFLLATGSAATQEAKSTKKAALQQSYKLYQQKCLGCHLSVADPEKPGRTRDDWYLVVNVMHNYGLDLTAEEGGQIVDLLYDLRKGLEKEAG